MDVGVLSVRYAQALLDYAKGRNVAQDVYSLCSAFLECFALNPTLCRTLEDPLLPRQKKQELLSSAIPLEGDVKEVLSRYFSLMIEKHRESYLASSLRSYIDLYRKSEGIAVVKITTAVELDAQMEEKILSKVSSMLGKRIELQKIVDPQIEGGFIFDIDDYRMNASVAARLGKIRRQLLDKNRRIV